MEKEGIKKNHATFAHNRAILRDDSKVGSSIQISSGSDFLTPEREVASKVSQQRRDSAGPSNSRSCARKS